MDDFAGPGLPPAFFAPASASFADCLRVQVPEHNMSWEFSGRNATQGRFRFQA